MSQVEHRAERSFAIKGTLVFTAQRDQFTIMEDAYLVCEGKKVAGAYDTLPDRYRQVDVLDMGGKFVIPGTCDIHVHASQASFQGIGQNIESGQWNTWFDRYAFPDESRFNDIAYAEQAYTRFAKSLLATPTTRLCAYATTSREATEILMKVLAKYGFAGYVGKVNMDRNSLPGLLETTRETIAQTRLWLEETKDGIGAIYPILTPRYFPSCTESCLEQLGKLAEEYHVPVQSHLSEGLDEIDWVRELAPDLDFYAQAYDRAGLLGPQTQAVMAHCIFSSPEEVETLKRRNVIVAHCPQSNMNSCGCAAPIMDYLDAGIAVGLGTDVGGGNTLNMFRTIFEAILASKVFWASKNGARNMDQRKVLSLPNAFYLATKGGGALWKSGSFEPGYCFDAVILDDSRFCDGVQRTPYERMERLITRSDDRDICAKYIDGACVYKKGE